MSIIEMNEFKTISQYPAISTIAPNKIKNANICQSYGYLLFAYHVSQFPVSIVFTDLTAYQDKLVSARTPDIDPILLSKVSSESMFLVTLNQLQTLKLVDELKDVYGKDITLQNNTEMLHKMGVIIKLEFYLKNFNDHLEGMCINLEVVKQLKNDDPVQLPQLITRIKDKFDIEKFHQLSPVVLTTRSTLTKRKHNEDNMRQPLKKSKKHLKPRFDTQQILFNLNLSSDDEDEEEVEDVEEDSFISVITSLQNLQKIPISQDNGKIFKLFGYLIEYSKGFNEIIFVEKTDLKQLNPSNSLILKLDLSNQLPKIGKKIEISVRKDKLNIGKIELIEFKIV